MTLTEATSHATETRETCPLCDANLDPLHPGECPRCDWVVGYRRRQKEVLNFGSGRDFTAAVLTVAVPGAGHFYKAHNKTAALAFAGAALVTIFVAATVTSTVGASLLLFPTYWAGVVLHAFWADDLTRDKHQSSPAS